MRLMLVLLSVFHVNTVYARILVDETWGSKSKFESEDFNESSFKAKKRIGIQIKLMHFLFSKIYLKEIGNC